MTLRLGVPVLLVLFALTAAVASAATLGLHPDYMDRSVNPCDDFYEYANGAWLKATQIPPEYSSWGAFHEIHERNIAVTRRILEDAAQDSKEPAGAVRRKVGDFYAAAMNEAAVERAGNRPLAPLFKAVGAAFDASVVVDDKASDRNIFRVEQGGLGLPDRDYYTKQDDDSKKLRAEYQAHVARILTLLGDREADAARHAATVLAMETRLAQASMTLVERRDPERVYHKLTRAQLIQDTPGFDWPAYLSATHVPASEQDLLVRQPGFFKELGAMVREISVADWRTYLRWHLIHATATKLSSPFVNENFAFYGKTLSGTPELAPRWKRVASAVDAAMGEAVGQLYVQKAFSPRAKERAIELVQNLRLALGDRIRQLDWMTESTREQALNKLAAFIVKIGYPDRWRDYSRLVVTRDSYVSNVLAANRFESERQLAKLGKPVDRSEWQMNAHTVNAYYDPTTNEICFPAGILQPPFFDAEADDAVNYGGIGAVIGHEMTHGFDDQGSQYDAQGNLKNWWTEEDKRAYEARQAIVVDQYEAYEPLPGVKLNGKLTLGENIADLGGLKVAFAAYQRSLLGKPHPAPIDGFTAEQRFFLNYAQVWRTLMRPEMLRVLVNTDPHSPPRFRVIGTLSDLPEMQQAFSCAAGTPMVRPANKRPTIW
jgi:putative endopeptidase